MHIHMHACMHTHTHARTQAHTHTHTHTHTYIYTHTRSKHDHTPNVLCVDSEDVELHVGDNHQGLVLFTHHVLTHTALQTQKVW